MIIRHGFAGDHDCLPIRDDLLQGPVDDLEAFIGGAKLLIGPGDSEIAGIFALKCEPRQRCEHVGALGFDRPAGCFCNFERGFDLGGRQADQSGDLCRLGMAFDCQTMMQEVPRRHFHNPHH
jgi:hypothetical protein